MSHGAASAFKSLVDYRVQEVKTRRSSRVANTGRFELDNMSTVEADELVAGDMFIHNGAAFQCNGVEPYDDDWFKVHARPWDGGTVFPLAVHRTAKVALLT
jgi:hypothetical protein